MPGMTETGIKELTSKEYEQIRRLVYAKSGIDLGEQKMQLVRSRLGKVLRERGFSSFHDYYEHVVHDTTGEALCTLLDAISTNTTFLFREVRHFTFMRETLDRWLANQEWLSKHRMLRIWSAACSSGEEPHSIAMVAHDALQRYPQIELKILATDISVQMLRKAQLARYAEDQVGNVPPAYRSRYLQSVRGGTEDGLQLDPELRRRIRFARFNLMTPTFPFRNRFDIIFCRNVMIYFDKPTQETLVNKFGNLLNPNGYLMIGHSESLHGIKHSFKQVEPATYTKM